MPELAEALPFNPLVDGDRSGIADELQPKRRRRRGHIISSRVNPVAALKLRAIDGHVSAVQQLIGRGRIGGERSHPERDGDLHAVIATNREALRGHATTDALGDFERH